MEGKGVTIQAIWVKVSVSEWGDGPGIGVLIGGAQCCLSILEKFYVVRLC